MNRCDDGHMGLFLDFRQGIFSAMKRSVLLVLLATVVSIAFGAIIKDRPTAVSNGSDIYVRWATEDESPVLRFVVVRRAGTVGDFMEINDVDPKGDYSSYEYVDRSVFRTTGGIFQYRIRVYTGETTYAETEIVTVSHVSSAARRTWGSIKAMFR